MVTRFEYKVVLPNKSMPADEFTKFLNNLGDLGWELCYMDDKTAIFKRAKTRKIIAPL